MNALLPCLQLDLKQEVFFDVECPPVQALDLNTQISDREIPDLNQYFSYDELERRKIEDIAAAKAKEVEDAMEAEMA